MLSAALLLLSNSLFLSLRLTGNPGSFPRPLPPEEERACLERWAQGDLEARNRLVEHNLRLVAYIARRFENTGINIEDLDSLGYGIIHIDEIPHTGADKLQNFQFGQSVDHLMSELRNGKGNNLRIARARYNLVYALGHTAEDADLAVLLQGLKKFRFFNELTCIQHTNNHSE